MVTRADANTVYSLLNPGSKCSDYVIGDVLTQNDCFTTAATQLGLGSVPTLQLDGVGFTGCVYNTDANVIMFGTSTDQLTLSSWQYICDGIPTTTTTTTTTVTTVITTTISTVYTDIFSLIPFHENCAYYKIPDVISSSECFDEARPYVGLGAVPSLALDGMGFSGCVYNPGGNLVLYGQTSGVSGATSSVYKYICKGLATTTTTTTITSTTSTTTTTITVTSTTSTTTTVTTSTSTLTTTTSTTSTVTTSTSTFTTTTYTGSSSSTTTSTGTTMTTTSSTFTTTTTQTTSTVTTSTSTLTTFTTTFSEGAAGFVGDDPLTLFGDVTKQFWLPDQTLVQLLATPELRLLGSAVGFGSEQWINRLIVAGPAGEEVLQVTIRSDIASYKPDEAPSDDFATLNVTLEWLGGVPLKAIPPPEAYAYTWNSVVFAFARLPHFKIGEAPAEVIVVEGTSARIVITSTAAGSFDGDQAHLAAKYAHLDFVLHMKQRDTCEGILPELWGLKPLSNETLAMMEAAPPH